MRRWSMLSPACMSRQAQRAPHRNGAVPGVDAYETARPGPEPFPPSQVPQTALHCRATPAPRQHVIRLEPAMVHLKINGQDHDLDVPPDMPLLWVIRDLVGLTGTKFGCGIAQCGACTVHLDGNPVR